MRKWWRQRQRAQRCKRETGHARTGGLDVIFNVTDPPTVVKLMNCSCGEHPLRFGPSGVVWGGKDAWRNGL